MIDWEIPENWETTTVRKSCNIQYGYAFDSEQFTENKNKGIPLIRIGDLGTGRTDLNYVGDYEDRSVVRPGDLLISMDRHFHIYKWDGEKSLLNQRVCRIESDTKGILDGYIKHYMEIPLARIKANVERTTVPHLSKDDLESIEIPVAPLTIQKELVQRLDSAFNAIANIESSHERSSEISDILLDIAIESVIDASTTESDIVKLNKYVNVNPRYDYEDDRGEYPHVPMSNVSETERKITEYKTRDSIYSGLAKFGKDDVLFARITPCTENGKVALVKQLPDGEEMSFGSTEFAVLSAEDGLLPEYLYYICCSRNFREEAIRSMKGSTGRKRVPYSFFREDVQVPIPSIETQKEIIKRINSISESANKIHQSIQQRGFTLSKLPKSLRKRAFCGDLSSHIEERVTQLEDQAKLEQFR